MSLQLIESSEFGTSVPVQAFVARYPAHCDRGRGIRCHVSANGSDHANVRARRGRDHHASGHDHHESGHSPHVSAHDPHANAHGPHVNDRAPHESAHAHHHTRTGRLHIRLAPVRTLLAPVPAAPAHNHT